MELLRKKLKLLRNHDWDFREQNLKESLDEWITSKEENFEDLGFFCLILTSK